MMIGKFLDMFRRSSTPDVETRAYEMDQRIQDERRLARLAKSEAIDRLFQGVVDDFKGTASHERH